MIFVDAHVHFHPGFDTDTLLDAAWNNFSTAAFQTGHQGRFHGVLMLTESAGVNRFGHWMDSINRSTVSDGTFDQSAHWNLQKTKDSNCIAADGGGRHLFIIAGCQVVTAENIEVLALGIEAPLSDGESVDTTIECVVNANGVAVIPWGAGKWFGKRGHVVQELIRAKRQTPLFMGDNGNRPAFWPLPVLFTQARRLGIGNLPGSDPLPFSSEVRRPGSFGFMLPKCLDQSHPGTHVIELIKTPAVPKISFGQPETVLRFFRNQIKMQIVKRTRTNSQ